MGGALHNSLRPYLSAKVELARKRGSRLARLPSDTHISAPGANLWRCNWEVRLHIHQLCERICRRSHGSNSGSTRASLDNSVRVQSS